MPRAKDAVDALIHAPVGVIKPVQVVLILAAAITVAAEEDTHVPAHAEARVKVRAKIGAIRRALVAVAVNVKRSVLIHAKEIAETIAAVV